ncbi:MAG TPA: Ig-like domain-containing protein [Paenibacillus sp.]|uniref:Ig-like domain-containing protein n=1 Tax=Paenibacillus sp. TaxID=58172 RepID=UPI0028D0E5E4|nr:Ig-like domain-containing protein [Paenibacillus sp.]HUC91126.1 Ig-like domain-containing protein [Paenibacillus sp.]
MRKIALLLLLLAAALLFAGFPSFQAAAAEPDTEDKFQFLREKGIFTGFADGSAGLHLAMSREQFAAVLFRLWDLREVTGVPSFSDVPKNRWSYGEIEAVADAGLMKGAGYRKFTPLAKVSVEQLAAVLVRAYGAGGTAADPVGGKLSAWARQDVGIALAKGWIPSEADYRLDAGRGMLVDASFEVYLDLHPEENPFGEKLDVHSVEPLSATTILVHLRTSVKSAVKEQFRLEDEGGRQVRITNTALNGSGTVVTLTTDKQDAGDIHTLTNYSLSITNIVLSGDKKKVTITTGKQTAGTVYTLTVSGVADAAGNVMDTRSNLYFGAVVDSTPLTIAGVSADKNKVVLTFSERLEEQYAENIASYMFDGGLGLPSSAVYDDGERRVTLTTSDQTPGKVYTVTVNFVRDRVGNTIAQNTKRSFVGAGKASTGPIELQNVKPVNENTIELTFGRSLSGVGISGLNAVIESDNGVSVNNSGWQIFAQRKQERSGLHVFHRFAEEDPHRRAVNRLYTGDVRLRV